MSGTQWSNAAAYERYVGRWSLPVAEAFVAALGTSSGLDWLDAGCGTGALTEVILTTANPGRVTGVDKSEGYVAHARDRIGDHRAEFRVGDAQNLPIGDASIDVAVGGLMLNFVPDPGAAVAELRRVLRPEGIAAAYVWDYAEGMAMMRTFWDAAIELDPAAAARDEGRRTTVCDPDTLRDLWRDADLTDVSTDAITVHTVFRDFDDYWTPLLGGQGSVPGYLASLPAPHQARLRDLIATRLPVEEDGSIRLTARAWTVRGRVA
ncbi:class I SAM-dependent methyltransferase [Micromonospora sp. KC213]|uniref:class I SAM-dependent methyltransferase n=1 Tax=Micromonospora sp. KC213 TaxID=2530378 RepID=UPI001049D95D|nr:class I SAM-dependent methyltransferase [Micromonospora sp. KC213]TDC41316.1 methyltransferase domain-containing protein [Micromonospora sp. KC213]